MEKEVLNKLVQEGLSNTAIAKKLKMHRTTVTKRLIEFGIIRERARAHILAVQPDLSTGGIGLEKDAVITG